jgi:uncharacterized iron-regulated membrane protein
MSIPLWLKAVMIAMVVAALFFAVNWYNTYQQTIGYDRAMGEVAKRDNVELNKQLNEVARLNDVILEAQNAAKKREEANRALAMRNAELLGSMRDTDAAISAAIGSATSAALADATRAFSALFGECRNDFETMGRAAAGHLVDVKKLSEAWPRKKD